jgi:hypothetical protein
MIELKRRNTVWLTALALLTVLGIVASGGAPVVQLLLLSVFAMAAVASTVKLGANEETIIDALKRAPLRQRMSPQAKEAIERARTQGGYMSDDLLMLDVGLIAGQTNYEGMAFRRTRNVSKDDDGVRPFVTLNVDSLEANRHANVRFEIYDQNGDELFVHEMRTYLREGEMSLMADHHLPLAGNTDVHGTGDWDLRVFIDDNIVAMHNFMLTPSMTERQRRLARERGEDMTQYNIIDEVEQEVPPRLQDLLGGQEDTSQQQQQPSSRSRQRRAASSESASNQSEGTSRSRTRRRSGTTSRRRR